MGKYDGINRAETTLYNNDTNNNYDDTFIIERKPPQKSKNKFGFTYRLMTAAILFGLLFGMSKAEIPLLNQAVHYVKYAVSYDLDKRENKNNGEIKGVTLIKNEIEKKKV